MLKRVLVAWNVCAIALLCVSSLAISAETKIARGSKLSDGDAEFVKEAAAGGMAEVELAGVADSNLAGARLGRGEYMVAEADESDRSFLMLWP